MENIKVKVQDKTLEIGKNTTFLELSKSYEKDFAYPIVIASFNGVYQELNQPIKKEGVISFYDLKDRTANRIYLNGLIFLTLCAGKELFGPSSNYKVLHSIDKGLYIETDVSLTEEKVQRLEQKMHELVDLELPITKMNVTRMDAIQYFDSIGDTAKADIMRYNTNTYVTLYKLGNNYSYFYGLMPVNTKQLSFFELTYINEEGFVLRFPTIYMEKGIKPYEHREKMFQAFNESRTWEKVMHLENVSELNKVVSQGNIGDIIRISETLQNQKLLEIARAIEQRRNEVKVILIAGPTSSGKTTTNRKLSMYLRSFGMNPIPLSMDDYFKDRNETPLGIDGEPDFECLDAVDLELFNNQIASLLKGETVTVPTFNFLIGMKEFKKKIHLGENELLLIEGIHGLNPTILKDIPKSQKCKIYLSPLTTLSIDNQNRIPSTDNRLLRRVVRDNKTRGYKVEDTLKIWSKVRAGEEKYIFPYQDEGDFIFNTSLIYELGVLKTYVEPLLYSVDASSPYYEEAKRLINFLRAFLPIPSEDIPDDSILREFIGKSCFHE